MRELGMFSYIILCIIAACCVCITLKLYNIKEEMPELTVFKACIDKATILNDSTICSCAEFVGHSYWCNGSILY